MNASAPFTFLEATKALAESKDGKPISITLCLSGIPLQLEMFLRAEAARFRISLTISTIPFGTLPQHLLHPAAPETKEVYILCPWDLVGQLDWRSGIPASPVDVKLAINEARKKVLQIRSREPFGIFFLPAPIPPVGLSKAETQSLRHSIRALLEENQIVSLPEESFGQSTYLTTGCPIAGSKLGTVAQHIAHSLFLNQDSKKVLITDLDETLWAGVIGEDGLSGISAEPEGASFRHFLYQTMLRKLKNSGIILAAVSRNSSATVSPALAKGRMVLSESDFAAVFASYQPKSTQIAEISRRFNIGLDQFVFIDDNALELEEVKGALPDVTCLAFPAHESELLELLENLHGLFQTKTITAEDQKRTDLYRLKAAGAMPVAGTAHDLTEFLTELKMVLTIHDRTNGDRARAVQLINKTNQFNLNGIRWDDSKIAASLNAGGRLLTASLTDRLGEHGEILALLIDKESVVHAFVLSCRVFQRRVEHAFLLWLQDQQNKPIRFLASHTEKNEPFLQFIAEPSFVKNSDGSHNLDGPKFRKAFNSVSQIFQITFEGR